MRNNPDICKEVIERLLQIEIDHIEMAQEETVNVDLESKSIRMDVYVKNSTQAFEGSMRSLSTTLCFNPFSSTIAADSKTFTTDITYGL